MSIADTHDLTRYTKAQQKTYTAALSELKAGRKQGHWMWFIFPQILGLGKTPTSTFYAIRSMSEAQSYLQHPLLGPRLYECVYALLSLKNMTARELLGHPDDLKLRSCLTLFWRAAMQEGQGIAADGQALVLFEQALDAFFDGLKDIRTLEILDMASAEVAG